VRPEFGPTLPQLLGPRLRALPRAAQALLALAAAVVAVGALVLAIGSQAASHAVVVRGPLTFNLVYPDGLARVTPHPGEVLRLASPAGAAFPLSYTVSRVRVPPYRKDINGVLPLFATSLIATDQRRDPGFILRDEGRVRINDLPGYAYVFQSRAGGRTVYGRRLLLFADKPGIRDGADLLLFATRSPAVPAADSVGGSGPLKVALRSFRLGTDRP
jgi:hypothetical protein